MSQVCRAHSVLTFELACFYNLVAQYSSNFLISFVFKLKVTIKKFDKFEVFSIDSNNLRNELGEFLNFLFRCNSLLIQIVAIYVYYLRQRRSHNSRIDLPELNQFAFIFRFISLIFSEIFFKAIFFVDSGFQIQSDKFYIYSLDVFLLILRSVDIKGWSRFFFAQYFSHKVQLLSWCKFWRFLFHKFFIKHIALFDNFFNYRILEVKGISRLSWNKFCSFRILYDSWLFVWVQYSDRLEVKMTTFDSEDWLFQSFSGYGFSFSFLCNEVTKNLRKGFKDIMSFVLKESF